MPTLINPQGEVQHIDDSLNTHRKVITVGGEMETSRWETDLHSHENAQLLLSLAGVVTCEVEGGIWIVPPQSAIFIPSGISHQFTIAGRAHCYVTLIRKKAARSLHGKCVTITTTPLLRELILRSAEFSINNPTDAFEARLTELLLHELATAPLGTLHLPMPSDSRLRAIYMGMMADPSNRGTSESWSRQVGISERSLARVIRAETGMTFGRWRQHLNILLALQWMAGGATVQQVAIDLGYDNVSSFVTMFRKALGTSPARYMADRKP